MAPVTAKDIAQRLGISPSAVSFALNGRPGVSEATRRQVLEAAAQLGYQLPRGIPPSIANKKNICFLTYVDHIVNIAEHSTFANAVYKGVDAAANAMGYQVVLRYLYANQSFERQLVNIIDQTSGIILLGTEITPRCVEQIRAFVRSVGRLPVIVVDNMLLADEVDCIGNDNFAGGRMAAEHLLSLGCRRIGYFRSNQRIESFDLREAGLRAALSRAGVEPDPVVETGISSDAAFADIRAWLETDPELPDAFFAENDVVAAAAIRAMHEFNIEIPDRVKIIGYDDVPLCNMLTPPLTTVGSHKESIGDVAFGIVQRRLAAREHETTEAEGNLKIMLSMKVRVRGSTVTGK